MLTQYTILDMIPGSHKPSVPVSQYDTGARVLCFRLRERSKVFIPPAGTVATICGTKPDGNAFSYTAEIEEDTVIADCTEQMTVCAGMVPCEIRLTDATGQIGSCNFNLDVERSPFNESAVSESDIPVFEQLAEAAAQAASASAVSAASAAGSATSADESATNAAESASEAQEASEQAQASASAAAGSASAAQAAQTAAGVFAEASAASAQTASGKASVAQAAAQAADASAQAAAGSADTASGAATDSAASAADAQEAAAQAQASATTATGAATTATGAASAAAGSASAAEGSATQAGQKATEAGASATAAANSATAASGSASAAATSATNAGASATAAAGSATSAAASATTATEKATEAAGSASDAADSADDAATAVTAVLSSLDPLRIVETTSPASVTTFSDGADGVPMKSLIAEIAPVQDLHGQANPYPAGGGKNLLDPSVLVTQTTWKVVEYPLPPGTYTMSTNYAVSEAGELGMYFRKNASDSQGSSTLVKSNHPVTRTIEEGDVPVISFRRVSGTLTFDDFNWQIESGSTATAFAPYSNICPISGWDGVEVTRAGKNLLHSAATSGSANGITWVVNSDGSITLGGTATAVTNIPIHQSAPLEHIANGPVSLCCSVNASYNPVITGLKFQTDVYSDGVYVRTLQSGSASYTYSGKAISIGLSRLRIESGTVIPAGTKYYPQIEIGSASTAYAPYTGQTIPITLPGTVYGGTLDVISGVLTVTDANIASYAGETLPGTWISDRDVYAQGTTPTTGAQVVYKLAEPLVYQLDPVTIESLLGTNNLFADTGNTSAEYCADPKMYIDNAIASAVAALS